MPLLVDLVDSRRSPLLTRALARAQPSRFIPARWPESTGTGGRFPPDQVAGLLRIRWPISAGIRTGASGRRESSIPRSQLGKPIGGCRATCSISENAS